MGWKYIVALLLACIINLCSYSQDYGTQRIRYDKDYKTVTQESENTFKDRLIYGGGLGLGFSSYQIRLAVSPTIGYRFNNTFSVGISLGYQYHFLRDYWSVMDIHTGALDYKNLNIHVFTPGIWARAKFLDYFFVHAEFEYNVRKYKAYDYDYDYNLMKVNETQAVPCLLVGGGLKQPIGNNISYVIYGLYDVLQNTDANTYMQNGQKKSKSPYANTIDIRIGLLVGF